MAHFSPLDHLFQQQKCQQLSGDIVTRKAKERKKEVGWIQTLVSDIALPFPLTSAEDAT